MAKDLYHDSVRMSLEKEGWLITNEQYQIKIGGAEMEIDLLAEHIFAAERGTTKIAVEVKSFIAQSPMNKFHEAMGQYDNYLLALEELEPDRTMFLAIPENIWRTFFQKPFIQKVVKKKNVRIIVYNFVENVIKLWITH